MKQSAVFLDRDGTIIREAEYLADPAGVELLPGAAAAIKSLRAAGFVLVVTSNQSGVARGYFTEAAVQAVNQRLAELLAAAGTAVDAMYYCPHLAEGTVAEYAVACDCRKPKSGMLRRAAEEFHLALSDSWVVGDKDSDIACGQALGLRTVLVLTGYGAKTLAEGFPTGREPTLIARNLHDAAEKLIQHSKKQG